MALSSTACEGCGASSKATLEAESERVWGRSHRLEALEERARVPIDARALDVDLELRRRVLSMPLSEVVLRVGPLTYEGRTRFRLEQDGEVVEVFEETTVNHTENGDWRVVQRDEDGALLREVISSGGRGYVRNGPGELRLRGVADAPEERARVEAFSALPAFTTRFGDQLKLTQMGSGLVAGRAVVQYRFGLAGRGLVSDEASEASPLAGDAHDLTPRRLRPKALLGKLSVDMDTSAPLAATLRGELDVEPRTKRGPVGHLALSLDFTFGAPTERAIVPTGAVPPIVHRPVDLDPLGFLERKIQTSTIIGGSPRPKSGQP